MSAMVGAQYTSKHVFFCACVHSQVWLWTILIHLDPFWSLQHSLCEAPTELNFPTAGYIVYRIRGPWWSSGFGSHFKALGFSNARSWNKSAHDQGDFYGCVFSFHGLVSSRFWNLKVEDVCFLNSHSNVTKCNSPASMAPMCLLTPRTRVDRFYDPMDVWLLYMSCWFDKSHTNNFCSLQNSESSTW